MKAIGVRAAADLLQVHENTVRNWADTGLLTDVRIPGTHALRLDEDEVRELMSGRKARMSGMEAEQTIEAMGTLGLSRGAPPHCKTCTCGCTCGHGGQHDWENTDCNLTRGMQRILDAIKGLT